MSDFLITFPILLVFAWLALRRIRQFGSSERPLLWLSFFTHQLAGVINIEVTKHYYGYGDMISYYRFGVVAADRLRSDFWGLAPSLIGLILRQSDPIPIPVDTVSQMTSTGSMQGISAFAMFFFFDSLYAVCACIAGAAFLSKVALYVVAREELPDLPKRQLLWACTLLPSALFWSCSLLKEPLGMIGLLIVVYSWHQLSNRRNMFRSVVLGVLGGGIVILIKGYLLPALGIAMASWYLVRNVRNRLGNIALTLGHAAVAAGVAVAIVGITGALLPRFSVEALGDQLAGLQVVGARLDGGTNYTLGESSGVATNQVALVPLALVTALFRPTLLDVTTPLVLASALEMTFFLVATSIVPFRRGIPATVSELIQKPFLAFCAVFVLVFGTCVGLATTNLGTLSRYRMPLTPFFAVLLVTLLQRARAANPQNPLVAPSPALAGPGQPPALTLPAAPQHSEA